MSLALQATSRLIRAIREILRGMPAPEIGSLAAEYDRLCREASQRLEQCVAMLGKGGDYQALQLAEAEPILHDQIAVLSFAEAPQWIERCLAQGLPVPPGFDPRAVQTLNALYSKGISANHPLYKEYRAAVSERDDGRALRVVRTIARLNAGDANAQGELQRLENKFFQAALAELRAALPTHDEPRILHALDEAERLGTPEKLAKVSEYAPAVEVRRASQRHEAIALSEKLAGSLADDRAMGAWRAAAEKLARLRALQSEHGFTLGSAAAASCAEVQTWVAAEQGEADAAQHFQSALSEAGAFADETETRLAGAGRLTLAELEQYDVELQRRWRAVEQTRRSIPEDATLRFARVSEHLRGELLSRHRQRRRRFITVAVSALVVCGVAAFFAVQSYRGQEAASRLSALRSQGEVEAAEKLVLDLRGAPSFAAQPVLRDRLDETAAWIAGERATLAQASELIAELEAAARSAFAGRDANDLATKLQSATELLDRLARGLRPPPGARFAVVRNELDAHFVQASKSLNREAEAQLASAEQLAAQRLSYDGDESAMRTTLAEIDLILQKLESRLQPPFEALALPGPLQARVRALRQRADLFRDELALLANTHEQLLQATTLDAYREALAGFDKSRLVQTGAVADARKLSAAFPQPDDILAALLLPDDPEGWAAAKADRTEPGLMPEKVLETELVKLIGLRDERNLGSIWEATISDAASRAPRTLYSREPIFERRSIVGGFEQVEWTAGFYDPARHPTTLTFMPAQTYRSGSTAYGSSGIALKDLRRSAAALALERLALERMTNAAGDRYERSLLRVFDDLAALKDPPPAVKAALWQRLAEVLALRPHEWGLHYCASLRHDLVEFARLLDGGAVGSGDWMLPARAEDLNTRFGPFFKNLESRSYQAEARLHRSLVRAVVEAGLAYGGFVDGAGRAHVLGEARGRGDVWGLASDPAAKIARLSVASGEVPGLARFTPLFFVPLDRKTLLAELSQKVRGFSTGPIPTPTVPFFAQP
jgi:hypothetical protein